MSLKFTNYKYLFCIILCLSFYFSTAQSALIPEVEEVASQTVDTTGNSKPKAIPLINIVREIDNARNQLKLTQKKTQIPEAIKKIDSVHVLHNKFLLQESKTAESFMKADPNLQKLNNLITKWYGFKTVLTGWESTVNEQEVNNSKLISDITNKEKVWDLSYREAVHAGSPYEVLHAINHIWEKTKETKQTIIKNNNYYLILETRINEQINITEQVISDLTELKNSNLYDIFYQRHKPLWNTSFKDNNLDPDKKKDVITIENNVNSSFRYFKNRAAVILFYIAFIWLISLFIRYLKAGFTKYVYNEKTKKLQKAKSVLVNQSIVCVLFLSFLAALWIFTNTPKLSTDITTLLILICSVPLIRPYMFKQFKNIIFFVILFFILNSAKSYLWFSSSIYRIYILIEALIVIGILFKFTHPLSKTLKLDIDGFGKLLIRLTPVIYILSIISIVSNVLGYTNLTDITLKISTQSGITTTFFYSLLMIWNGVSIGVINRHYGVKASYDEESRLQVEKKTLKVSRGIITVIWIFYFLIIIDVLSPLTSVIQDSITEPYKIGSLSFTLKGIIGFILILIFSFSITKIISFLINDGDGVLRIFKLPKGVPAAVSLVIRYFILGFGFVLALGALGIDLSKFNLMAGALGLGIGFGLQTVISNFVSGLILVFERPILHGDTVEVNNLLGIVNRIGVRSSSITTFDGAEVIVPNNNLISNDLINWTLSNNTKRIEILVGTSYDSDPNRVLEILSEIASNYQFTLKNPAPRALFSNFGDSSLNFRLLIWVHYELGLQATSDISISIYNRFKAEGIEIPFPQRDLNVRNLPDNFNLMPSQKEFNTPIVNEPTTKNIEKPMIEPLKSDFDSDDSENSSDGLSSGNDTV
ncbi:mechanosensitive ion channel domain-containing protein [Formosa sp. PL04]|uniref:mechanosensitive ion channel domain-containing protein n=1 Tax=Formosa sp. PL04 TaxID=3081755 RepID=UPI002981ACC7|nr:mechanosensitive ion channel domain-containing protein [Formosa sp. PL04]MDW5287787.1 mechanosensitive ion channel [Formosa sp. PL04]